MQGRRLRHERSESHRGAPHEHPRGGKMRASQKRTPRPRNRGRSKSTLRVGDEIIRGLREAVAVERGKLPGVKITRRELPDAAVAARSRFAGTRIVRLRERFHLSQPVFARALNVSAETVKKWEQETRVPDGAAVRLLEIAEEHP